MTAPSQILPELSADDFSRLTESIKDRGVEVPVVVDEDGEIIDGHNRAIIADSLGIEYPKTVRAGLSVHEKRLLAVELNLARRQLTDAQKALMGEKIEPDIAAQAERRQHELGRTHGAPPSATDVTKGRATDEVARTVGLGSGRTYERAKDTIAEVKERAPELMPRVTNGDLDLDDVRKELREREKEQRRAQAEREQATAARVLDAGGDPHGERVRADLRAAFSKGRAVTSKKLLLLDPVQVVAATTPGDRLHVIDFVREARVWLDAVERELDQGQGIRLVS